LEMFPGKGLSIPIYRGSDGPIISSGKRIIWEGYGSNGLGDCSFSTPSKIPRQREHAVTALLRMINEKPGTYTMVLLGPMTNLALALRLDPAIATKVKSIIFMGGTTCGKGNATIASEHNIYSDPEAAHIVLQSFGVVGVPIYMVSWETTVECGLSWQWFDSWIKLPAQQQQQQHHQHPLMKTFIRDFLYHTTKKYEAVCRNVATTGGGSAGNNNGYNFNLCSTVAMAIALDPSLVEALVPSFVTVELTGDVSRGATVVDCSGKFSKKWKKKKKEKEKEKKENYRRRYY